MRVAVLINTHPRNYGGNSAPFKGLLYLNYPERITPLSGWVQQYVLFRMHYRYTLDAPTSKIAHGYVPVMRMRASHTITCVGACWRFYVTAQTAAQTMPWYVKIGRLCASLF